MQACCLQHLGLVGCCRKFHEMAFEPRLGVTLRTAVLTEAILTYLLNLVIIYSMRELLLLLLTSTNDCGQAKLRVGLQH